MTHGAKGWHRRGGAIGQRLFPGRVFKNMRMPGHMGDVKVTTQNLRVIQVREAENLLLIEGAVPGARGAFVVIRHALKKTKPVAKATK
jgi:large subunit ribosomal protein L3